MTYSLKLMVPLVSGFVLLASTGCQTKAQNLLPLPRPEQKDITLTIEAKVGAAGEVAVSGSTNLPRDTQLTALALRYLVPTEPIATDAPPTFAILDYQTTTVESGQWATDLNLWQVAADGRYQETWQHQTERLDLAVRPNHQVHFVITLAPRQFLATIDRDLTQNGFQLPATLVRTTDSGEALLWAEETLYVELPEGTTAPPSNLAQRLNGGWGERYRLVPEPPLPYTLTPEDARKTNAPPATEEFLQ